jgi:amino acid transporter
MPALARKLRLADYFALAFGSMIGVGWLVVMDDWLGRGGPLGAMLGFALGGIILLPVGYIYGQWVLRLPDAAGEAAYTAQVFPPIVSYLTGWIMLLAYFIVCPWEAVAVGRLAAYIFPSLDSLEMYSVNGHPVFLPRLLLGVTLTLFLTVLNYRGIRASATFQNWATGIVLVLFVVILATSAGHGSVVNFHPAFAHAPLVSILLTLQIVPYFMTGFESVPKVAEEAHPEFRSRGFFRAIALAIFVGTAFYVFAVAAVSYVAPWQNLIGKRFATAFAFEHASGAAWLVRLILGMAAFALFQVFNGNFVSSSRLDTIRIERRNLPSSIPFVTSRGEPRDRGRPGHHPIPVQAIARAGGGCLHDCAHRPADHRHAQHGERRQRPVFRSGCGVPDGSSEPGGAGSRKHEVLPGNLRAQRPIGAHRRALSHAAGD